MDPEKKQMIMSLLLIPVAYIILIAGIIYAMWSDAPYIGIVCGAVAAVIIAFAFHRFFSKTVLKGKVPYSSMNTLRPIGSEDEREMRELKIIVSGYTVRIKFKLYLDGFEIADAKAGDRFRILLSPGTYVLAAKDPVGTTGEGKIPESGDCEFYVWCNRKAKKSSAVIRVDDATRRLVSVESEDAASYATFERIIKLTPIMAGISAMLAVILVLLM